MAGVRHREQLLGAAYLWSAYRNSAPPSLVRVEAAPKACGVSSSYRVLVKGICKAMRDRPVNLSNRYRVCGPPS